MTMEEEGGTWWIKIARNTFQKIDCKKDPKTEKCEVKSIHTNCGGGPIASRSKSGIDDNSGKTCWCWKNGRCVCWLRCKASVLDK